jgi:hypothetical protein
MLGQERQPGFPGAVPALPQTVPLLIAPGLSPFRSYQGAFLKPVAIRPLRFWHGDG